MHDAMTNPPTDEMVEIACRAYYNSGVPVHPPVFEGMRAALEAAISHQGEVVKVSELHKLADEWERVALSKEAIGCAYDLRDLISKAEKV